MARRTTLLVGGPVLLLILFQSTHQGATIASGFGLIEPLTPVFGFAGEELQGALDPRVERWIERYLTEERGGFETFLAREGAYGALVRAKLAERDMPEGLVYAAMIESGFLSRAHSPASASGLWQFLGATARAYGLTMDGWVDERRDPIRATDAALDYLSALHGEFGSWVLAVAAYNAGPARVHASLARLKIESPVADESVYWAVEHDLPRETRNHVAKVLAASLLASRAERFGLFVVPDPPLRFDLVLVPPGTSLVGVAQSLGASPATLRALNPHLIQGVTPPGRSMPLRVPEGRGPDLLGLVS